MTVAIPLRTHSSSAAVARASSVASRSATSTPSRNSGRCAIIRASAIGCGSQTMGPRRLLPRDDDRRVLRGLVVGDPRARDALGRQLCPQDLGMHAGPARRQELRRPPQSPRRDRAPARRPSHRRLVVERAVHRVRLRVVVEDVEVVHRRHPDHRDDGRTVQPWYGSHSASSALSMVALAFPVDPLSSGDPAPGQDMGRRRARQSARGPAASIGGPASPKRPDTRVCW